MSETMAPWLAPLGLTKNDFSEMPPGEDAALWGLKNQVIPELKFSQWVSETYKIPSIDPNFFNMAIDFSLLEKFAHLQEWNSRCFPIYLWENTLFIACLAPKEITFENQKCCLVVAPYSALNAAWKRHETGANETVQLSMKDVAFELPDSPTEVLSADQEQDPVPKKEQAVVSNSPPPAPSIESLGDLDFSGLDGIGENQSSSKTMQEEVEHTNTKVDQTPMNILTSATETIQQENNKTSSSQEDNVLPDLDFGEISGPNSSLENKKESASKVSKEESYDDDFTPVPFISQEDKDKFKHTNVGMGRIKRPEGPFENTMTDNGSKPESYADAEDLITESDMIRCLDIKSCKTKKDIISHIFLHLKRDYRKLMWIEVREDSHYYPTFISDNWAMTKEAWNTPVNLSEPNIFRIASLSNLPFHGEVSQNEVNSTYFENWTAGKAPDVSTIYPVSDDDELKGFLVAFSMNEEFDEVSSLSKIQKLISLSDKKLFEMRAKKSA